MSIVIDDDKYHLNCKIPTDNLYLTKHIRDNYIGLVNYIAVPVKYCAVTLFLAQLAGTLVINYELINR